MRLLQIIILSSMLIFVSAYNYNEKEALEAVHYASAAYCADKISLGLWLCEACSVYPNMIVLQIFNQHSTGVYGFLGIDEVNRKVVIAFRGTRLGNFKTLFTDSKVSLKDFPKTVPGSKVHSGFLSYYMSVRDSVRDKLPSVIASNPNFDVWITGHSLGAAAAQLAAVDLHDIVENPIVYCFGSPRVGNHEFAQHYHTSVPRSFLVVHANDPVTDMPPRFHNKYLKLINPTQDYYHVPQQIVYDKKMRTYKIGNPADGEDVSKHSSWSFSSKKNHQFYFGLRELWHTGDSMFNPVMDDGKATSPHLKIYLIVLVYDLVSE